jgi:hypothetical protein
MSDIRDFATFRKTFVARLGNTVFRQAPGLRADPVAREIRRKQLGALLVRKPFLLQIHKLGRRYSQYPSDKSAVLQLRRNIAPVLKQVRYAQKTLRTTAKNLVRATGLVAKWLSFDELQQLGNVTEMVRDCEWLMQKKEEHLADRLHPATLKVRDRLSRWENLIPIYNYDLPNLREKARDHWLWEEIDDALVNLFKRQKVTMATRYSLIAGILEDLGVGIVEPGTIKQHLYELRKR